MPGEGIPDHEIGRVRPFASHGHSSVANRRSQGGRGMQAQMLPVELDELSVDLEHVGTRARTRRGEPARKREPTAADEHGVEWRRRLAMQLDFFRDPERVGEEQIARFLETYI